MSNYRYYIMAFPPAYEPQAPRTVESLRRSLDGSQCVMAWTEGTQPQELGPGMSEEEVRQLMNGPEWCSPEAY